jgi:FAD binding domain/Berberine and berberine like
MTEPCREVFPGERIETGDPRYPTLVRGFNLRWVGEPQYVQLCGDAEQVLETVRRAYGEGKRITVRSGGHCYEDFVCDNQGGVIIDLSPMSGVYQGPGTGLFCIEGGATLWNVYNALYREYAVTLPGGSCYSVGAGGHLTGAGYGLLSRLHGLTSDHLEAVELVRVDARGEAELLTVRRDSSDPVEQDVFWAHTGAGGGNFGIVTKFWFKAVPAPQVAWLSTLAWNWKDLRSEDEFADLIRRYGEWHVANSAPGSEFAPLFALLALKQKAAEDSQIVLTIQVAEDNRKLLEEFEAAMGMNMPEPTPQVAPAGHHGIASPSGEARSLPWLFATQALDGVGRNQYGKYKSAYMKQAFPQAQIETMWKYLHDHPNPTAVEALLQVDSYGCQVNTVAPYATAVAQRSSVMKLQYQTYWAQPQHEEANLKWIRQFYGEMYGSRGPWPDETMDGCFVNYPDVDLKDWQYLYYKDNYPRLQKAKALCDPHDVFRHQQSIELPLPSE